MKNFKNFIKIQEENSAKLTREILDFFGVNSYSEFDEKAESLNLLDDEDILGMIVDKLSWEHGLQFLIDQDYTADLKILPNGEKVLVTENYIFDGWNMTDDKEAWVWDYNYIDLLDMYNYDPEEWSRDFWRSIGPRSKVWHNTIEDRWEEIEESGELRVARETRGITNRSTNAAIFVTTNPDEAAYGTYGPVELEIDLYAMKRDRYMPMVVEEEPVVEQRYRDALAHLLDIELYDSHINMDGISYDTLIIYDDIPLKYIERID